MNSSISLSNAPYWINSVTSLSSTAFLDSEVAENSSFSRQLPGGVGGGSELINPWRIPVTRRMDSPTSSPVGLVLPQNTHGRFSYKAAPVSSGRLLPPVHPSHWGKPARS